MTDIGKALRAITIMDDIYQPLIGNYGFWAMAIKHAIDKKQPCCVVIKTIQSDAQDNFNMVAAQIGNELSNEILNW
jgi:hypothetical protein